MNWVSILGKISIWIILAPLFIGLFGLKKLNKDSKLILTIVFIGTVPQVLNPFLKDTRTLIFLYNLYTPLEFFIYWYLFYSNIKKRNFKNIGLIILILFVGVSGYLAFNNNPFLRFITVWVVVNNNFQLIMAGLCLLTFFYSDELDLSRDKPLFWFMIGIILYASCTVIFYSLWNYLKRNDNTSISSLYVIHHIFNITLYLLFSWGLILNSRKHQFSSV